MANLSYSFTSANTFPSFQPFFCEEKKIEPSKTIHILLVEDNIILQNVHSLFLGELGYQVTIAGSGEEALTKCLLMYDAILMDIDLPGMNGIATTRTLFEKNPHFDKPIIACTTHNESELKPECLSVGMVDYLQKPVSIETLGNCLKNNLKNPSRPS